jgi:hypothetical protein
MSLGEAVVDRDARPPRSRARMCTGPLPGAPGPEYHLLKGVLGFAPVAKDGVSDSDETTGPRPVSGPRRQDRRQLPPCVDTLLIRSPIHSAGIVDGLVMAGYAIFMSRIRLRGCRWSYD